MLTKKLIVAALALTGALGSGVAQARGGEVQWSVSIGVPIGGPVYTQPYSSYPAYPAYSAYPAYVEPYPVYSQPYPVYSQPYPVYSQPYPVYYHRPFPGHRHHRYHHPTHWDRDGDGIPNRYDRVYNPRWDRDGDGVPNRYDRVYSPR